MSAPEGYSTVIKCPFIIDLTYDTDKEFKHLKAQFLIDRIQQAGFSAIYTTETCCTPFGGCHQVDLVLVSAKDDTKLTFDLKSIQEEHLFNTTQEIDKAQEQGILSRAIKV